MTEQEITALGPAFAADLRAYRGCFKQGRKTRHFDTRCRGSCPTSESVRELLLATLTPAA